MTDPVVELREVGKRYGTGVEALRDVTVGFPRGKLTTLLGPSGCGKTTLLKIVAGLIQPTGGEVWAEGRRVEGPGPERAFVFQDFALLLASTNGVHSLRLHLFSIDLDVLDPAAGRGAGRK